MSPAPLPTAPVPLARITEMVHEAGAGLSGPALVLVERGDRELSLGFWSVPTEVRHPSDALIGWRAPAGADAIGLVAQGTAVRMPSPVEPPWHLLPAEASRRPVLVTVLLGRDGTAATLIDQPDREPLAIDETPEGLTADALARSLGLATPAPRVSLGACIEAVWLDRIAAAVFDDDRPPRAWADLAMLHPLAPSGPAQPGALLAMETRALDLESDWGRMRLLLSGLSGLPSAIHPPDGTRVRLDQWFDDGSFARWMERTVTPAETLLADLLDVLPESLGRDLVDALTKVRPHHPWDLDDDLDDEDDDLDDLDDRADPHPPCWCWPPTGSPG